MRRDRGTFVSSVPVPEPVPSAGEEGDARSALAWMRAQAKALGLRDADTAGLFWLARSIADRITPHEPAPSAPAEGCGALCINACNGGPCRLAQESPPTAPADVEALADEIGTESRKSGGVRLWEFSAVELREFARRLSGAQQADPVEELPAIATDIPAPVEG